jgi:hypothetical protein
LRPLRDLVRSRRGARLALGPKSSARNTLPNERRLRNRLAIEVLPGVHAARAQTLVRDVG